MTNRAQVVVVSALALVSLGYFAIGRDGAEPPAETGVAAAPSVTPSAVPRREVTEEEIQRRLDWAETRHGRPPNR